MSTYLQIIYVLFITVLAVIASTMWTMYAFDLAVIGWGQPLMVTILLVAKISGFCLIQSSSPSEAEVLKARLEFQQAELARQVRTRKINTAISTIPGFPRR